MGTRAAVSTCGSGGTGGKGHSGGIFTPSAAALIIPSVLGTCSQQKPSRGASPQAGPELRHLTWNSPEILHAGAQPPTRGPAYPQRKFKTHSPR